MQSINPATGETLATYEEHSDADLQHALEQAAATQREWRQTAFTHRAQHLRRVAELLRRDQETLARLAATEMGKPLEQGRAEIEKSAVCCDYFAQHGAEFLAPEEIKTEFPRSRILYQPLGVLLAIMPWNFPFWQVVRAAAPCLMAGNVLLLKHASNVCGCALALQAIFREARFPEGAFTALLIAAARVEPLIANPLVAAVTLTGSTEAGKRVAAAAGAHLKKTVLELGGSDPYVVLADADLEQAAGICAASRLINSGQSCIAAKRFIVVRSVRARFEELFIATLREKRMGDPLAPGTEIGPLARLDLRDQLHGQVQRSIDAGARVVFGAQIPEGPGAFYAPTVLSSVRPGMAAFDEETFGPVAAIIEAMDEDEAVSLANQTVFGLGAAVFTRDRVRGERLVERLEAGVCFVNDLVRSDPRMPFGGIKQSGYGRELGLLGIREFVNAKSISVR